MNHPPFARLPARAALSALGLVLLTGVASAEPKIEKSVKVAAGLYELVVSPSTGTVYVASTGVRGENNAKVVALDAATLDTRSTIDVAQSPVFGLGINDETQTLYGTDTRGGALVAIDLKAGKVVATVKNGEKAHLREAVVDEATNRVYVSVFGVDPRPPRPDAAPTPAPAAPEPEVSGKIWIVDGATNTLANVIENPGKGIGGIAVDGKNNRLYATDMTSHEVVSIDLITREVTARYPSGGDAPINLALDAATGRLFVANQKSGTVTVLDSRDGTLLKTVVAGEGTLSVAINTKTNQVYATNRKAGTVTVIDAATYAVVANLQTGTLPQTVAIDAKTGLVYVSNKARGLPRDAPKDTPPVEDPNGDTVSLIRP